MTMKTLIPVSPSYNCTAMTLHWLIATLLLWQFVLGWYVDGIPRGTPARGPIINLHKSAGMLIGLLMLVRIGWRLTHTPPSLTNMVKGWQKKTASLTHWLLYILMLVVPISGYLASNFSKHGVNFFNVYKLAPWGADNRMVYTALNQVHDVGTWLLLALVSVHVLAALKHLLIDRDTIFFRMWPRRKTTAAQP
jgi:cytochrome b561